MNTQMRHLARQLKLAAARRTCRYAAGKGRFRGLKAWLGTARRPRSRPEIGSGARAALVVAACLLVCGCGKRAEPVQRATILTASAGYEAAAPGWKFEFPRDDGSHPAFGTEWWYYTGHVADKDGGTYGYELTFFRIGVSRQAGKRASEWAVGNVYMAHLAVTDEANGTFHYFDTISRGSLGEAGARVGKLAVHLGKWYAGAKNGAHVLEASRDGWGVDLTAVPLKPPAIHGTRGISVKGAGKGNASHYYSYTRMKTTGRIIVNGGARAVSGISWFDHEFGSGGLGPGQVGWDWFGVQLDDGTEAMLYLMRDLGGGADPYSSGTLIDMRGQTRHLRAGDFHVEVLDHWRSAASGANYPSKWRITIPSVGWDVNVAPTVADQELRTTNSTGVTYYEGSTRIAGKAGGRNATGKGYVEMTGYGG